MPTQEAPAAGFDREAEVAAFMESADDHLDETFLIDPENTGIPTAVQLYDAVRATLTDPQGNIVGRTPIVRLLEPATGEYKEVAASDFLQWVHNATPSVVPEQTPALEGEENMGTADMNMADVSTQESATSDIMQEQSGGPSDEVIAARREISAVELAEKLGLPNDSTPEMVGEALTARVNEMKQLLSSMNKFDPTRRTLVREIEQTLLEQKNLLKGSSRDKINEYLTRSFRSLERLAQEVERGEKQMLSPQLKAELTSLNRPLRNLRGDTRSMTTGGRNAIDTEAAQKVAQTLRRLPKLTDGLRVELRQAEDALAQVVGFKAAQEVHEGLQDPEKSIYRNEQVQAWASELGSANITPERVKEIEVEMLNAVRVEAGMFDDPDSPQIWFSQDVCRNRSKSRREGTHFSGRENADIGSWQHVAELISDMLTGKYSIQGGNSPLPIELLDAAAPAHEKIRSGAHRAAALAMLYGNDWLNVANDKGILVEQARK